MTGLMVAFFKRHLAVFILIASLLVIGFSLYLKGWSDRGNQDKAAAKEYAIKRINNRGRINEEVRNLDDAGVCGALGGVFRNNQCQ